jgi:hypothetical protein
VRSVSELKWYRRRVDTLPYGLGSADATMSMPLIGLGSTVYGKADPATETADVQMRDVAGVLDDLAKIRAELKAQRAERAPAAADLPARADPT